MTRYPALTSAINIALEGLLSHLIAVHLFGLRGVTPLAELAFKALAAGTSLSDLNLLFCVLTIGTFSHTPSLIDAQYIHHSRSLACRFDAESNARPGTGDM